MINKEKTDHYNKAAITTRDVSMLLLLRRLPKFSTFVLSARLRVSKCWPRVCKYTSHPLATLLYTAVVLFASSLLIPCSVAAENADCSQKLFPVSPRNNNRTDASLDLLYEASHCQLLPICRMPRNLSLTSCLKQPLRFGMSQLKVTELVFNIRKGNSICHILALMWWRNTPRTGLAKACLHFLTLGTQFKDTYYSDTSANEDNSFRNHIR